MLTMGPDDQVGQTAAVRVRVGLVAKMTAPAAWRRSLGETDRLRNGGCSDSEAAR